MAATPSVLLVSDTSVLVDLERGNLIEAAFQCRLTMVVPDILYERELLEFNGPYLKSLGLGVVLLSPSEVQLAQQITTERAGLSVPDAFALSCATRPGHTLLTGDRQLRSEAAMRKVNVVGLLWILDQMAAAGVSRQQLHEGLTRICSHSRCRLPPTEVKHRLAAWGA